MARSILLLLLLAIACVAVHALPSSGDSFQPAKCSKITKRKSWHKLSSSERKAYVAANVCLQAAPGVYKNVNGLKQLTAYEDFVYVHKIYAPYVHYNAQFTLWHRYFMWTFEAALRNTCKYRGPLPYWDQKIDRADSTQSILYSVTEGFGGNGKYDPNPIYPGAPGMGGGCVTTGKFAEDKYRIRLGKFNSTAPEDECLRRSFSAEATALWMTPEREAELFAKDSYIDFWSTIDDDGPMHFDRLGMHGGGHATIGGTMGDAYISPSEPLFWPHHVNIDRIYREWQKTDLKNRLYQVGGDPRPWLDILAPDYSTIQNSNITLEFEVKMGKLAPTKKVKEIVDITAGFLCYDYE